MSNNSIYKSEKDRQNFLDLYDRKLKSLNINYEDIFVETSAGKTHIIVVGDAGSPPVVLLHGINAGAPVALESIKGLSSKYRIYAIDTVGQAGKSSETQLPINDESYGKWLSEIFDHLHLEKAVVIGVSYGSVILARLMEYSPQRIEKAIFVVPIAIVNARFFQSIFKLLFPMRKFLKTENDADLLKFIDAYYTETDDFSIALQKATLLGVKMDTRRPSLIKTETARKFSAPVYILTAENDIFAPAEKLIKRSRQIFKNLAAIEILPGSKHVPAQRDHKKIEEIISGWLAD